jgi:hypothetical protein
MATREPSSRERRLAENEVVFRAANEAVKDVADDFVAHGAGPTFAFFCECSDANCAEQLDLTLTEYEAVRAHGARFVILTGHEEPDVEEVVETRQRYTVVEKTGASRAIAEESDPRG